NSRRAVILAQAEDKIPKLLGVLRKEKVEDIKYTLVYCEEKQVNILTKFRSELGLRVHRFDSTVSNTEREGILESLAEGTRLVLVASKCVDEGVDVPNTRVAYFLSSTSNPREFVQRRGRILRTANQKHIAEMHHFIVFPDEADTDTFTMIAKKELPRFAEFSGSALNQSMAKTSIIKYLDQYNLSHLMDKKPWDVYNKMKEEFENDIFE